MARLLVVNWLSEIGANQMWRWEKSSLVGGQHLGPLEIRLLRTLWKRGDATVRELVNDPATNGAYTTVMTTLDRLYKKGLLNRFLDGRAYRYRPKQSEEEYHRQSLATDLEKLFSSARDTASPISFLVDTVTQHDARLLDELEWVVGRKRHELNKRGKR
jgi:predicted transcriptional regulator